MNSSLDQQIPLPRYISKYGRPLDQDLVIEIAKLRKNHPYPVFRFLPGTTFTDGKQLFEVVYGVQSLEAPLYGWVVAIPSDYLDYGAPDPSYRYTVFNWEGKAKNGAVDIKGKNCQLKFVKSPPRITVPNYLPN
jgi:hypothetical protein